jgi:beta-RFAP synthase
MITVQAPSRLHFGLFHLGEEAHWSNSEGRPSVPARRFGGIGLMVREPGLVVSVRPAPEWSAEGPLSGRALEYAQRLAEALSKHDAGKPQHIVVQRCADEHAGLGTGTQLSLAVGRAILAAWGIDGIGTVELGRLLGRGARSAIGIHGFERGGFLVEAGQSSDGTISPLVARCDFPEEWRVVLAIPSWAHGLHGDRERQAFATLRAHPALVAETDALCRLVLLGMLPALAEHNLEAFGEAVYDFNRRVGERFAAAQGGPYAHPRLLEVVAFLRQNGVSAAGQSSWGAAIFAVAADQERAKQLAAMLRERFALATAEVLVTSAQNSGAVCTR